MPKKHKGAEVSFLEKLHKIGYSIYHSPEDEENVSVVTEGSKSTIALVPKIENNYLGYDIRLALILSQEHYIEQQRKHIIVLNEIIEVTANKKKEARYHFPS